MSESKGRQVNPKLKLLFAVLIPLIVLLIPISEFTTIEHRFVALFFLAALLWVLEPIPVFATSVLIIVLELLMVSDKGLFVFRNMHNSPEFGELISYKAIMASFASPIIMLFLGGFFLAKAASKYRLDINLARVLIRPFGKQPRYVMLGLMIITGIFSMFMSNTATVAMMLALITPILALFGKDDPGRVALLLAIPFAANIGGIGTPIGTPPNAIAMKYLTGPDTIGFGKWMSFGVPYVVVMTVASWFILVRMFPSRQKKIDLQISGTFLKTGKAVTVYVTFLVTILLWLTDFIHGMNSYVVAMLPIAVFVVSGILGPEDIKRLNWDVLWLIAGGIALGMGLDKSGLSLHLIKLIPFSHFPPVVIAFIASLAGVFMSTFISNTATANLFLPIISALAISLHKLGLFQSEGSLILIVAISCSLAMSLPVSTPPNAIAYASGDIESNDMLKAGSIVGAIGLFGAYLMLYFLVSTGFI
jgi:sodium-dependent dicarboxylate transporter 2/3/5